jgi:phospholipid/cholesterol/gamma-HCH transport system permease protein
MTPPSPAISAVTLARALAPGLLAGQSFLRMLRGKWYGQQVLDQLSMVGPGALVAVLLVNGFAGMVFTIQTARELGRFGAIEAAGGVFALAFCREMSPVLTAGILAGKVGAAFTAELATMRVTEQIDVLQMLKTHPVDYLVLPRVVACVLMMPVLSMFTTVVGLAGGTVIAKALYQLPPEVFLDSVRRALTLGDLGAVLLKAMIFGVLIALIGCSWGLTTRGGAREVGESTTAAVVNMWVAVFAVDFLLSLVLFGSIPT